MLIAGSLGLSPHPADSIVSGTDAPNVNDFIDAASLARHAASVLARLDTDHSDAELRRELARLFDTNLHAND